MVTGDSWCLESARIEVIDICFAFLTFLFFFLLSFECLRISQSFPIQNKILLVSGFFIYFSRPDHVSFHAGSILFYVLLPSPLGGPPPHPPPPLPYDFPRPFNPRLLLALTVKSTFTLALALSPPLPQHFLHHFMLPILLKLCSYIFRLVH